jgi:peptidoglycan/xylan/chitin deacetylase (PgdA/CDA1 family)
LAETKNILLTFDYELFQGKRSGSVKNCLITPTTRLLDILDQFGARSIFFVDMLYVYRLSEIADDHPEAKRDLVLIKHQITELANRGHYVFNHLHPHWLDAKYLPEGNEWDLSDTSKYSFLALTEEQRGFIFEKTMALLRDILKESRNQPTPNGFRAGGLYIQPFSVFKPYFEKHGIKYDFSVLIGVKGQLDDNSNEFDFSMVKENTYCFANEVELESKNGTFYEYALRPLTMPFIVRVCNGLLHRIFFFRNDYRKYGDGIAFTNRVFRSHWIPGASMETFSVELLNELKLPLYLKEAKDSNYLHLLSHPKLISEYNLKMFKNFLNQVTASEDVIFDFEEFNLS